MTNDLPPTSNEAPALTSAETPAEPSHPIGLEIDVLHEPDDVFVVLRIRLPRKGALTAFVKALTERDMGFSRFGGPAGPAA